MGAASAPRLGVLDHVYIGVGEGAGEEAAVLRAAGVRVEQEPTRHVGDGTSSVSAVFENFYLELQYLDPTVSGTSLTQAEWAFSLLRAHWRQTGASPLGIGLRRQHGAPDALPFRTEASTHEWMGGREIRQITSRQMRALSDTLVPDLFVVPQTMALPGWIDGFKKNAASAGLLDHPLGVRRLSAARLVLDGETIKDLRPHLPVVIRHANRVPPNK